MEDIQVFSYGKIIEDSEQTTAEIEAMVRKEFASLHAATLEVDVLTRQLSPEIPHVGGATTRARYSHEITVDGTITKAHVADLIIAKRAHYKVLDH